MLNPFADEYIPPTEIDKTPKKILTQNLNDNISAKDKKQITNDKQQSTTTVAEITNEKDC